MQTQNHNILVIGMSKMGKTHFGGQLYGRLQTKEYAFKIDETPDDLSLFEEVWEKLNDGLEGEHTKTNSHQTIGLPIISDDGLKMELVYPDYGGEQIRGMIEQREISDIWQQQIQQSNHWFLFIRPDLMEKISDVTTQFYQQIEQEKEVKSPPTKKLNQIPENSSAFYVELLQTFLFVKKRATKKADKPKLTILLSCWDKLKLPDDTVPMDKLNDSMPFLANFVKSNWSKNNLEVLGLSSLGRDLDLKKNNEDFQINGPEEYGYLILPDGKKSKDLTLLLNSVTT